LNVLPEPMRVGSLLLGFGALGLFGLRAWGLDEAITRMLRFASR